MYFYFLLNTLDAFYDFFSFVFNVLEYFSFFLIHWILRQCIVKFSSIYKIVFTINWIFLNILDFISVYIQIVFNIFDAFCNILIFFLIFLYCFCNIHRELFSIYWFLYQYIKLIN